ncbi:MAG TPA: FGGY-family carbohydrate kinase [Solirubrobacteraceae bacterium]|nr:FGGY-family carbohydrate kinase [Solirubrobacteraceae bacterium]
MTARRVSVGEPLVLGVDLGTGSVKGVAATGDGAVVATATRTQRVSIPRPSHVEMDPREWWSATVAVLRDLAQASDPGVICGLCVSGLGPCLVLCDAQDRPTRPAILYGIDMRAEAEIIELTDRYGADRIRRRTGKALSSQAIGPKLLWVARHEPDVWSRSRRWHSAHSYILARLTGEYVLDHHTASQNDPLYDLTTNQWYEPWLEELTAGLDRPRLAWPGETVGRVTASAAAESGVPAGTPMCAGTVDAWAESVSAGVRAPGDLMLMYGSTMFFVQVARDAAPQHGLWKTAGVWPSSYTLAAGMSSSGLLADWVRDLTGGTTYDRLVREAAAVPAGADGLVLLPYFAGERTPIFDPKARGVIVGLTLRHRRGHLLRAAYEGIAYGVRQILDVFDATGEPPRRIVAVGGGTQGGLWTQIVTDVTGRPQIIPAQTIGASYGGALLAARAAELTTHFDWSTVARELTPDPAVHQTYEETFAGYRALYPLLRNEMHRLAALGERASTP